MQVNENICELPTDMNEKKFSNDERSIWYKFQLFQLMVHHLVVNSKQN